MCVRFPDWTEPGSYRVLVLPELLCFFTERALLFAGELNQLGSGLSSAEFEGSQLGSRPTSAEGQGPASPLA